MPEWIFQGGIEEFRFKVDSERKTYLKSKITDFQWVSFRENLFQDREQRKDCHLMNLKIPKLTRDELHVYVISEVLYGKFTQAYKYVGCIEDDGKFIPNETIKDNNHKKIDQDGVRLAASGE